MTEREINSDAQDILSSGVAMSYPRSPAPADIDTDAGIPYVVIPTNYHLEDLEKLLPVPTRQRARVVLSDVESFILYMNDIEDGEKKIYVDIDAESERVFMVGILNDNGGFAVGWRDHRCVFEPKKSVEWKRWSEKNKKAMSQADFAAFIEDNLADIAAVDGMPTGNDMLQLAMGFERTAEKRLKSKINLQSGGIRLEYVDDEDRDTRTSLSVFERFTIGIPVFEGSGSAYPLQARLKYRENAGKLSFWYELIRPDRVLKTAVFEDLDKIREDTGILIIKGTP